MVTNVPLKAIFGAGRSGTTWLGSIVNSHPQVAYRFEPFHRLKSFDAEVRECGRILNEAAISPQDLQRTYTALLKADPLTDKPPFFQKEPPAKPGKDLLWPVARKLRLAAPLYRLFHTPAAGTPLVFKEVTYERCMANMLQHTAVPVIYLVRHPCGNVMSDVRGQQEGKMPSGRQTVLASLLANHNPALLERYQHRLDEMTVVEKTALLWRIDLEIGMAAIQQYPQQAMVITYEQICDDAHHYVKTIFDHFQLSYAPQTQQFLNALYDVNGAEKQEINKDLMDNFFTVYRNPSQQKTAWKKKISDQDRHSIEAIVQDSPSFQHLATLGGWD